jgi:hypothetical protein
MKRMGYISVINEIMPILAYIYVKKSPFSKGIGY